MPVRNLTHGTLKIKDGAGTPNSLTIPIMEGNLRFTERKEARTIRNRGTLKEFAEGQEEPCAVSFSFTFEEWKGKTGGGTPSPMDALKKRGEAAAWTSTSALTSPYTVTLEFTLANVESAGGQNEVLTFTKFVCDEASFEEGQDADAVQVSGKALLVAPTSTRA